MANQRDRDTNDLNRDSDEMAGTGGSGRQTPEGSSGERMGGRSDENVRGIGEDEDEFEETDEMDEEEGDEEEGTI